MYGRQLDDGAEGLAIIDGGLLGVAMNDATSLVVDERAV